MNNIEILINKIREEEKEKLLVELDNKKEDRDSWKMISDYIEEWGNDNQIYQWHLNKIKNSIYTIIRYSLGIDRMAQLRNEQFDMALDITESIIKIIQF